MRLACDPPLDWPGTLAYLAPRAIPGVETVTADGCYARAVRVLRRSGWVGVGAVAGRRPIRVVVSDGLRPVLADVAARVRRLLDLDTDPVPIAAHLARDPRLAPLVARRPALRLVTAIDGFELAVRAVLGQGVTVGGASLLSARLMRLAAEPLTDAAFGLTYLPISAERLASLGHGRIRSIGITRGRAACLAALARATTAGDLPELANGDPASEPSDFLERFQRLPGIGPWTAHYVAMRALGWSDAFPAGDLGLRRAAGGLSPSELSRAAERWRPWRAYAARHLWASAHS